MKSALLFILALGTLAILGLLLSFYVSRNRTKGYLQITAAPKSKVYLDNVLLGETPFCRCKTKDDVNEGEHTLKLVPENPSLLPFETTIQIEPSVMTVVGRTFGKDGIYEGSIMTLRPLGDQTKTSVQIISSPPSSNILVDNVSVGVTPLIVTNITPDSDHEITVRKKGYKEKILRVHTWTGYSLESRVDLAIDPTQEISPTPTASPAVSPTPQPVFPQVIILDTPTGFLRVHSDADISSEEIGRVSPGDILDLLDEKDGWYEIKMTDGKTGWISATYAQKK